ncbi:MAG: GHKL domain-containing protein [Nitrospirales bacterium]|nr:GHKL domain-containing protein [Nitrospirales bacterium]
MESWEPLKVLILGAGKGGTALIDLLARGAGVEVCGVADKNPRAPGLRLARSLNIPTATNVADLMAKDGAHLIVDVTGDATMPSQIAAMHASNVETMSGRAARLLWTLVQEEQELRAQLMQADKLATLGTFAAQIAHDLKNPLYCIREFAQFIEEELDPSRIKEYSREILKADTYLTSIVEGLTAYTRSSCSEPESVRLADLLDQAVKMARFATVSNEVEILREYQPVPSIHADPAELLQVFVNLITNAVQAMKGQGRVTLMIRSEADKILVSIKDTGPGIPATSLSKIFTPFFTTKERGAGTGLGLSIVKTLVNKYGGDIAVESEEGKGSIFMIRFPVPSPVN